VPPWPAEVLEERAGEIAAGFAALLTRQAAWRHRRVETITVLSHEQVRRAVSVDFTVPTEHRDDVRLSEREWIVPLALLAKRPLVNFDLRAEDESSVPLLRAEETQAIARELLYVMLEIDREEAADDPVAGELIERVLAAGSVDVTAELAELDARHGGVPGFAALADRLSRGFLLCAVLGDVSRRRVIKFAYDEPLARPARYAHFYDAPGCTEAASYHAEVAVPSELRARRTELADDATGEVLATGPRELRARTTRLVDNVTGSVLAEGPRDADRPFVYYTADTGRRLEPGLSVRYGTERGRFLVPAALVAWVIALELALPWLFADLKHLATFGGPAISVLLSVAAVFSALVLRSGEHPLVRLVLAPYRLCLAAATLAAVLAAATLAFRAGGGVLSWCWGVGALVAALAAGILTEEAARAPSSRERLP
jgi:hypothetical protein